MDQGNRAGQSCVDYFIERITLNEAIADNEVEADALAAIATIFQAPSDDEASVMR